MERALGFKGEPACLHCPALLLWGPQPCWRRQESRQPETALMHRTSWSRAHKGAREVQKRTAAWPRWHSSRIWSPGARPQVPARCCHDGPCRVRAPHAVTSSRHSTCHCFPLASSSVRAAWAGPPSSIGLHLPHRQRCLAWHSALQQANLTKPGGHPQRPPSAAPDQCHHASSQLVTVCSLQP